ncbi:MAG: 30S ribosomal protein S12 methylthiotransferase RimO [Oscillospiraceae bacterium]|nr:30S ribosomal protein S12 methylthiotransferase RimO [Oscillospiraceae bacterium]
MADSVGIVSLGCAKNQVDGEMMLAALENAGWKVMDDAALADVAIVNTCGFIQSAKQESINEILELAHLKKEGHPKAIVVTGCLAERYREQIMQQLPECDAVCGIGADADIDAVCRAALAGNHPQSFPEKDKLPLCGERRLLTPSYYAYLKIAEGCDNRCSYCAIPFIRGRYRSRPIEEIVAEAETLVKNGAKELTLIAQDTTKYGWDLYDHKLMLPTLLRRLCKIDGLHWIRFLYCYPDYLTDDLLDVLAQEPKVLPYIGLPLQHCSGPILKAMHRWGNREMLTKLIAHIREKVPGVTLRTTLITGFPGETEQDFTELCEFVKEVSFDRLGCFPYSQEEGTAAAKMPNQIPEDVKQHRAELIMEGQMDRTQTAGERLAGTIQTVLCEGWDRYAECWFGRTAAQAPDDIDGKVFFTVPKGTSKPGYGMFVPVLVTDCIDGDLVGELHLQEGGAEHESAK